MFASPISAASATQAARPQRIQPSRRFSIAWDNANAEAEGIDRYRVYRGTATGVYAPTPFLELGNVNAIDFVVEAGTWFFAVTAVTAGDEESPFSNEINTAP